MNDDRRTKTELLATIDELRSERDAWRNSAPSDKEATAIAACVKALNPIHDNPSYTTGYRGTGTQVSRVLHYLADRYGVVWGES